MRGDFFLQIGRSMNVFSTFLAARLPFFYGYLMAVVAVLAQVCSSPGQTFAIASFTPYLQNSLGLSNYQLSSAYMLGTLLAAPLLVVVGPISDRCGLRWTTVWVAVGLAIACWSASRATNFASILFSFLLLRLLGQGALTLLSGNIVSMWFQLRLGTVNSVMSIGGAMAFAAVPVVLIECIEQFGWRNTYLLMGWFVLLSLVPLLVLTLRNRPEDLGQLPDGLRIDSRDNSTATGPIVVSDVNLTFAQAAGHWSFWILAVDMMLWAMIGTGIVFYALPIFAQYGIPPEQSKLLFSTFAIAMLFCQILGGVLADRYPMHRLLAVGFLLLAVGAAVVPLTTSRLHVHLFAALFGAGQGLAISVNSAMWVRYYGRKYLGTIRGAVWCMTVAGSGLGPFLLGLFVDHWGSFTPGLWLFVGLLLPLGPLSLFATKPNLPKNEVPAIPSGSLTN